MASTQPASLAAKEPSLRTEALYELRPRNAEGGELFAELAMLLPDKRYCVRKSLYAAEVAIEEQ